MYIATKVSKSNAAVKAIVGATFPNYKGRTIKVAAQGKVTFYDTNASGGSHNRFHAVTFKVVDGKIVITKGERLSVGAPWANPVEGKTVEIPAGVAVVEHSMFCGKDCGITIHVAAPEVSPVAGLLS